MRALARVTIIWEYFCAQKGWTTLTTQVQGGAVSTVHHVAFSSVMGLAMTRPWWPARLLELSDSGFGVSLATVPLKC